MAGAAVAVSACVCVCRYADQVVHRLLAAIIGWEPVAPSMLDPDGMGEVVDNMNTRHTMAQYAGRASVGLHTLIYFRGKEVREAPLLTILLCEQPRRLDPRRVVSIQRDGRRD